jgi:hypothetical protein
MAGLFGRSAAVREKALASSQPYAPAANEAVLGDGPLLLQAPSLVRPTETAWSARQNEAAPTNPLSDLRMTAPPVKRSLFGQGGAGRTFLTHMLGSLGDQLAVQSGGQPIFARSMLARQQAEIDNAQWQRRYQMQRADRLADEERERMQPRYFSGASDQVRYNPATGETETIYDAPEPYETYGNALGYEPGTPEYRTAIQDYVLRSYGPTAGGVRSDLEEQRLDGRLTLEGVRQSNRAALRAMPTYRDRNPRPAAPRQPRAPTPTNVFGAILAKQASGQPLTPAEQQTLGLYSRGGRRAGAATGSARTATDPRTGKKVQWDGKAWVPVN